VKGKIAYLWSNLASNKTQYFLLLSFFFLPVQLNYYFWPTYSLLSGLRSDLLSPTLYLTDFFFVPLTFYAIIYFFKNERIVRFSVICFCLYLLMRSFLTPSPTLAFYYSLRIFQIGFLSYLLYTSIKNKLFNQIFRVSLLISAVCVTSLAIAQFLLDHSVGGLFYYVGERTFSSQTPGIAHVIINGDKILRPYASFPHPNVLAGFLVAAIAFVLSQLTFTEVKKKLKYSLPLLFISCGVFLTFSRAATISLLFIYVLWILKSKKYTSVLIGGILAFFIYILTPAGNHLFSTVLTEDAVVKRIFLLNAGITLFTKNIFIGIGPGHFLPSLSTLFPTLTLSFLQPVHSLFLLFLVELGIIGVLFGSYILRKIMKLRSFHFSLQSISFLGVIAILGGLDHYLWTLQQGRLILVILLAGLFLSMRKRDVLGNRSLRNYPKRTHERKNEGRRNQKITRKGL